MQERGFPSSDVPAEANHWRESLSSWQIDFADPQGESPTTASIAAARAAQQRERDAFTMETGIRLDQNGRLPRRSHRFES
jgi:hypothetical protein